MIPRVKKYVMDESLSWEERYRQLEAHHVEETQWYHHRADDLAQKILATPEMFALTKEAFIAQLATLLAVVGKPAIELYAPFTYGNAVQGLEEPLDAESILKVKVLYAALKDRSV